MTFEEFMRGYGEYKQQRGAGGNSGASLQWNANAGGQWNPGGQDGYGTAPGDGWGISYDEFMRGYEEYKRQGGPQTGYGAGGGQRPQGGWQGISFEAFMEGFYQQHPERRPAPAAQEAPAQRTGFALGGQTDGQASAAPAAPAAGTSPQEDETPAGAQGPQAEQNRQLLAGLNWSGANGAATGAAAPNRALQLTASRAPAVGGAESDWTIERALAAAAQARQAAGQNPVLQAARENPGLIPGWSPEGRAALEAEWWKQNPGRFELNTMLPAYFWNGLTDGLRSAANGAAGLAAGLVDPGSRAETPAMPGAGPSPEAARILDAAGVSVPLGLQNENTAAAARETALQTQEKINRRVLERAKKSEQKAEALNERFAGKEGTGADLARWIGAGAGSMAPQIAAGWLGGPAASGALIFGQGMGDYYADALQDGASTEQAVKAGLVGGAANYGIEKAFGGIPMVGEGVVPVEDIVKRYVRSRAGRAIVNRLAEATGEGAEEVLENYLKPVVQNMAYGKEMEWPTLEEQIDAFAGGFAASLVTGTLMEDLPDQQRAEADGAKVRAGEGGVDALMRRAREVYDNEQTRKTLAGRRAAELLPLYEKGGADAIPNAQLGELAQEIWELDGGTPAAGTQAVQEAAQTAQAMQEGNMPGPAQTPAEGQPGAAGAMQGYPQAVSGGARGGMPALFPGINLDQSGAILDDAARQLAVQGGRVSEAELAAMDRMAGAKGLRLRYIYHPAGAVDGWVSGDTITVNLASESGAFGAAVHEVGHTIKAADAGRFAQFEQAVLRLAAQDAELGQYAQAVRTAYTAENSPARASLLGADGQLDAAAVNEEVALKLAEQLVGDPEKLTRAVTKERGLGEMLLDFIRGIKNSIAIRLTGSQKAMLDEAERTLVNLLRGEAGSVEGQRMSIQTDENGQYVKVDTDQDIFEGKTLEDCVKIARKYIKDHFQGAVLPVGSSQAFVNGTSTGEYAYPADHRMRADVKRAKMQASTELDNLLSISTYLRHEPDDGRHPSAAGGWDVYRTIFEIDGQRFTGEVKIMNTNRGRLFYDVTQIEKIARIGEHPMSRMGDTTSDFQQGQPAVIDLRETQAPHRTGPARRQSTEATTPYGFTVAQDGGTVNTEKTGGGQKDSLSVPYRTQKGQTLREYLTEQYPGMIWPIADPPAANAANAQAGPQAAQAAPAGPVEAVNAQEAQDTTGAGPGLLASGKSLEIQRRQTREFVDKVAEGLGVPRWASREFLRPIAAELAESIKATGRIDPGKADELFNAAFEQGIVIQDEMVQQYGELKKELRSTALTLDRETREGKSYNEWRKQFFGALNLASDGMPVDVYYQELCERYPELFDSELTHPADQAERILEVYKSIRTQTMNLDAYYGDDAEDFKAWAREEFDRALEELAGGVGKVRRLEADNARAAQPAQEPLPPMGYAEVERIQHEAKKLQRQADRAMARAALTAEDKKLVDMLLAGGTSEDYLRSKGQENLEEILKVYQARKAVEDTKRPVKAYNAKIKEQRDARAMAALEGTENWTDKQTGMQYSMETMQRNIRDISRGDEAGRRMVEEFFAPVQVHEAAATRMKNEYRERIRKLGLNQWESAYTQIYGELEALDGVQYKSKEREHLAEALEELKQEHGREINEKKAREAVPVFRKELDALFAQINQALVENGYEPVEYRRGYFPHYSDSETDSLLKNIADLVGHGSSPDDLPTSLAGLTAGFKPGRRWNAHALERKGFETAYDALKGFDLYLEVAADVIHHTGDIRNLRALAEAIRYKYGDEGIREQIRRIRADEKLTESQRDEQLAQMGVIGKSHLSRFVQELDEYTNLLAGKKSRYDRAVEYAIGRGIYRVMNKIESKVGANMVAVNLGSWLTNFLPVAQVAAEVGQGNMLRAARDTVKNWWHSDGFEDRSDFLTNRAGSQMLSRSKLQRASDFLSSPMQMIDGFASNMVTRAYYYKNLRAGMNPVEALQRADRQAAGLMADRSKGAMPTLFASKNPLTRMLTMFQLEPNNTLRHIAKDIRDEEEGLAWIGVAIVGFVYSYIFDDLYELLTGRRCALDPLDIFNEAMGDMTGFEVPNLVEEGYKAVKGEASREDFVTQPAGVAHTVANTAKNLAQEVPFVGGLLGGGRLPVSAALPDLGALNDNIGGWIDGDKAGLQALYGVGKELAKPMLYTAMPLGGGQLKKTAEGLGTMVRGGYYKQGREGEQLQTAVDRESMWNWLKALAFGRSAITEVGEYYDTGRRGLTAEQTAIIKELGMSPTEGQQWMETFGGRADNSDRSNFYQVRFGEEAAGLDERLARMEAAGADGVRPSKPDRTLTVNGEDVELGAAAYKQYLETRANGSYELLGYLPQLESAGADDALQTAYARRVQEYMAEVAREQAADAEPKPWVDAAREYAGAEGGEVNERLANAILARVIISMAKADKQPNGSSVKGSRKRNALAALEAVGFGTDTAAELWEMFG